MFFNFFISCRFCFLYISVMITHFLFFSFHAALSYQKLTNLLAFVQYSYFSEVSSRFYLSKILLHSCYLLEYLKTVTGSTAFPNLDAVNGSLLYSFEHALILKTLATLRRHRCLLVPVNFCYGNQKDKKLERVL